MGANFQLTKKGETSPSKLTQIDEAICNHFNIPVHPTRYCNGWFDTIGFKIALGKSLGSDQLRKEIQEFDHPDDPKPYQADILKFLEENYTSRAWGD